MKIFAKFNLIIYILILFSTCKKIEQNNDSETHGADDYYAYTEPIRSLTNSFVQVGDSIYHFDCMEGVYFYIPTLNKNAFNIAFDYSLNSLQNPVRISILTEVIKPEIFFQKGSREINTLYLHNDPWLVGGSMHSEYYSIRAVLIWDSVLYENRRVKGKGSLEIKDTLFTNYQDTYWCPNTFYPPQKIEFEFKDY
jgi:hypothetical protein